MSSQLLQIKIEPTLKQKLQRIAISKGLNITSYIKMTMIDAVAKDADWTLTENGFTVREERRLLKSVAEGEKEYKKGKLKKFGSMRDAINSLDE